MMMNKPLKRFCAILIIVMLMFMTACANQGTEPEVETATDRTPIKATLAGGSTSGMMFIVCSGISECVNKSFRGSSFTIVPGNVTANVLRVNEGEVDFGMAHGAVLYSASRGEDPYEKKQENLASIAAFYPSTFQIVMDKSLGIKSFGEIIDKKMKIRISVDQQGSSASVAFTRLLEAYGVTLEEFEDWGATIEYKNQEDSSSMLADGAIDGYTVQTLWPATAIQESGVNKEIMLLPIEQNSIDSIIAKHGYSALTIPQGTYDFLNMDYATFSTKTVLITAADASEELAYKLTQALVENIDYMKQVHVGISGLTVEAMTQDTGVPLHPGAVKYYKEIGAIK